MAGMWMAAVVLAMQAGATRIVRASSLSPLPSGLDAPTLFRLLSSTRKRKDWKGAHQMLCSACATHMHVVQPIHYNVALAAISDAAEWQEALALLEHMPTTGVMPDVYSYSAAISACSRAQQPDRAITLFKQMCSTDVTPNIVCFNAALAACQRTKRYSQLLALFSSMPAYDIQPNAWAYSAAIDAVARVGQWQRALELLDDLEQDGHTPLRSCGSDASLNLTHILHSAIFRLLNRTAPEWSLPSSTAMARQCARACVFISARHSIRSPPPPPPFTACRARGRYDHVLELYKRLRRTGATPNSHVLASSLTAAAMSAPPEQGWSRALAMLRGASRGTRNVHCYTTVMRALERSGRWEEAHELLDEMRREQE
ncbi:MAG: hypothetical protein SGPRY_013582 [Prymnesium sp.]